MLGIDSIEFVGVGVLFTTLRMTPELIGGMQKSHHVQYSRCLGN